MISVTFRESSEYFGGQGTARGLAGGSEGFSGFSPLTYGKWCAPKCWGLEAPPPVLPGQVAGASRFGSYPAGAVPQVRGLQRVCEIPGPASLLAALGSMKSGPGAGAGCWCTNALMHACSVKRAPAIFREPTLASSSLFARPPDFYTPCCKDPIHHKRKKNLCEGKIEETGGAQYPRPFSCLE